MTPERARQLRELAEMSGPDSAIAHAMGEIARLRAELAARPTRAEILREAADDLDTDSSISAAVHATARLRRMADAAERGTPDADPTPLRWGLNDIEYGDDDSTTVLLSGPHRAPYVLELNSDRAAALRDDLAGPEYDADGPAMSRFEVEGHDHPMASGCTATCLVYRVWQRQHERREDRARVETAAAQTGGPAHPAPCRVPASPHCTCTGAAVEFAIALADGFILDPTLDRADADERLARYQDAYPDAHLVHRGVHYGPWQPAEVGERP